MSEERVVTLLEEIRELQNQQLQLSKENTRKYEERHEEAVKANEVAVRTHDKAVRRGRIVQVGFVVVMFLFLLFVIYAEWFMDGIPKPSWVK